MNLLSVTILTHNEEQSVEACLNSLIGVADEIVVVDSFSNDHTVEICRRYGCRISFRRFRGYGAQRQYATSLTTHQYVLSVDADEVLSEQLRESIKRLKREGFTHRVYSVLRRNFFCGVAMRHSGWEPDISIRLFNKRYANWNLKDIAERITFPPSLLPALLDGELLHYRCTSTEELNNTEDRHAGLRGHMLASQLKSVGPVVPLLRGVSAFLATYIGHRAFLDGAPGHEIARRNFRSEVMAYRLARRILKKQEG